MATPVRFDTASNSGHDPFVVDFRPEFRLFFRDTDRISVVRQTDVSGRNILSLLSPPLLLPRPLSVRKFSKTRIVINPNRIRISHYAKRTFSKFTFNKPFDEFVEYVLWFGLRFYRGSDTELNKYILTCRLRSSERRKSFYFLWNDLGKKIKRVCYCRIKYTVIDADPIFNSCLLIVGRAKTRSLFAQIFRNDNTALVQVSTKRVLFGFGLNVIGIPADDVYTSCGFRVKTVKFAIQSGTNDRFRSKVQSDGTFTLRRLYLACQRCNLRRWRPKTNLGFFFRQNLR